MKFLNIVFVRSLSVAQKHIALHSKREAALNSRTCLHSAEFSGLLAYRQALIDAVANKEVERSSIAYFFSINDGLYFIKNLPVTVSCIEMIKYLNRLIGCIIILLNAITRCMDVYSARNQWLNFLYADVVWWWWCCDDHQNLDCVAMCWIKIFTIPQVIRNGMKLKQALAM